MPVGGWHSGDQKGGRTLLEAHGGESCEPPRGSGSGVRYPGAQASAALGRKPVGTVELGEDFGLERRERESGRADLGEACPSPKTQGWSWEGCFLSGMKREPRSSENTSVLVSEVLKVSCRELKFVVGFSSLSLRWPLFPPPVQAFSHLKRRGLY